MDTTQLQELLGPRHNLRGLVRYTGEVAQRGYRLNRFITSLTEQQSRQRFDADPKGYMTSMGLSEAEMQLVLDKDCMGMFNLGVNIYAVAKAGTVLGVSLPEIGALMRKLKEAEPVADEQVSSAAGERT